MAAIKISDLVQGATFETELGTVKIVEVVKDGYGKGDHQYRCTVGEETAKENNVKPFEFADDAKELKAWLNTHKI